MPVSVNGKKLSALDIVEELNKIGTHDPKKDFWEAVPEKSNFEESDQNDAADRFEDFEKRTSILKTFAKRLRDVESALEKIKKGKYGICEVSGEPIEVERLEANPSARTCTSHMEN